MRNLDQRDGGIHKIELYVHVILPFPYPHLKNVWSAEESILGPWYLCQTH